MKKPALKQLQKIVSQLPASKKQAVIDFAEYLRFREIEEQGHTAEVVESLKQVQSKKYRSAKNFLHEL